jgi:hypothetical protein
VASDRFQINRYGRLVLARVVNLTTDADVAAYTAGFGAVRAVLKSGVLCADHRAVRIYPPIVAEGLVALFTGINAFWQRAALVAAPTNATLAIQLGRVVRESKNPSRQFFVDTAAAGAFLSEVLDDTEQEHLRMFLAMPPRAGTP